MDILIFILLIIIYFIIYVLLYTYLYNNFNIIKHKNKTAGGCDVKSCGALDPVSDPKYNMQQIVKQSILLEEHLINKNKRCRDCITKHFQHIIGLAEEAQMLATNKTNNFPLLDESVIFYNNLFQKWMNNRNDENNILDIADKLRIHRKKLIAVYFFNDDYDITKFSTSSTF